MADNDTSSAAGRPLLGTAPGFGTRPSSSPYRDASPFARTDYESSLQQAAADWIQENQTLAVLGGFALGVFMGVMMRR